MEPFDFGFLAERPDWWSGNKVKRLGKSLAAGSPLPENSEVIMNWYHNLATRTARAAQAFAHQFFDLDQTPTYLKSSFRLKSTATIADKVNRTGVQLSSMWDFAGARLTANVLHDDLRGLSKQLRVHLEAQGFKTNEKDYIDVPQRGYRALHVLITGSAGNVELQLRTLLQSEWANTFEKLADKTGRKIRYDDSFQPTDPTLAYVADQLYSISENIHAMECNQSVIAENSRSILRTLAPLHGMPISPEAHLHRAKVLSGLSEIEARLSEQAEATLELRRSLRILKNSLQAI